MLSVESLREHCRGKPGSQETFPFDLRTLVFKVAAKMYALCGIDSDPLELSLKCDPEEADELRELYPAVKPGYHLNKRHWNTVTLDGTVGDKIVLEWLDRSYDRVVAGLTKRDREALAGQDEGRERGRSRDTGQRSLSRSSSTWQRLSLAGHDQGGDMDPIYINDEHKEELDSDTYRITQAPSDLDKIRQSDLKLYLSALSPADIADFYWGDQAVHEEDPVVVTVDDFTDKEGGSGLLYCVVKRSGNDGQ